MTRKTTMDPLHGAESATELLGVRRSPANGRDGTTERECREEITRLWADIEALTPGTTCNRLALGQRFHALRSLYSDRQADVRRTLGHGVFEAEIIRRGYRPRTVRSWIEDYEAALAGKPLSSAKRKARRLRKSQAPTDPLAEFAALLPFEAAQAAYRAAARILHPDHGGGTLKMQQLNVAWSRVESFYASLGNVKIGMRAVMARQRQ